MPPLRVLGLVLLLAGATAPAAVPLVWFKADAITGVNSGAALAAWTDASGNGNHATQTTAGQRPAYFTNVINGLPAVRFTSASSTFLSFNRSVQDDFTIVCVFRSTQGLGSGTQFYSGAGLVNGEVGGVVDDFGTCLFANGQVCAGTGNPDTSLLSSAGLNDGQPHLFVFTRTENTGNITLYVDGSLAGTATGGTRRLTSPPRLVLGAQQTAGAYLSGDLAEVKLFDSALSDTDRQAEEVALRKKYAIRLPSPVAWFKGDAITGLANGAAVGTWFDATANANNATQTTASHRPTFIANALNGLPVVRFDATAVTWLNFNRPVQDDFTIVGVFRSSQGSGSGSQFYSGAGLISGEVGGVTNDFGSCLLANGQVCAGTGNPDTSVLSREGYNDGRPHLFIFERTRSTGQLALYLDGSSSASGAGGTASLAAPSQLTLGAQPGGARGLSGDLAEMQLFNTALNDEERLILEAILSGKYALVPPAPTGLAAVPDDSSLALSWTLTPGATGYNVKRATADSGPFSLVATVTTANYVDSTLTNGVTYWYVVSATNATGEGPNSAVLSATPAAPPVFGVYRQLWNGLNSTLGNTLAALTNTGNNPNWPLNPTPVYTRSYTNFEADSNVGLNAYGQRLRAFVVPPTNGSYTFWISSDDASELYLSSDEKPANKTRIAWVAGGTNPREWGRELNQQSAPITLEAGRRYYLEAVMVHVSTGADNLAVRWQVPGDAFEEPLPCLGGTGTRLIPCVDAVAKPGIYQQPANLTVTEGVDARLALLVTNQSPVGYQWRLNGTNLPGANATRPAYTVTNVTLGLNGQLFSCVVSNAAGAVTSSPATLTVTADTTPPAVVRLFNVGPTNVQVNFSKEVELSSATATANYVFTNGLAVINAVLNADSRSVTLGTAPLVYGSNYSIVMNGIRDRVTIPNIIATNTVASFVASPYVGRDIGNPPVESLSTVAGNGIDVTSSGSDIGGWTDQFSFSYQPRVGDFDVRLRLAGLSPSDVWAKAGLMARETLEPGSRFAAALATPAMNGCFFEWRDPASSQPAITGAFPANFPNTWLRLRRSGNVFTGFAGYDGQAWTQLGSIAIPLPNQIYLGLAVSSHNSSQAATARFRDVTDVTNAIVATVINPHETLGPSSRKTPIVISEIMYKPAPRADTNNVEFVELYNSNPWFHDVSGYQVTCADMHYTLPAGTIMPGGGFLVIAASPESIRNVYGLADALGPYIGSLKKAETLQLLDETGAVLLTVPYSNESPWPVAADGTGHSLVLAKPTYGEEDPRAWDISNTTGGSPGQMGAYTPGPLRNVVINEFLAHTDPPDFDYIELYNHANQAVDLSGCILTDDATTNKFIVPPGTSIPARGFVYFTETSLNFALSAGGETIYLKNPDATRVLDVVHFGGQENGVATGRFPDGASEFCRLSAKTPGKANSAIRPGDVVINELMYHPLSGDDNDHYIELYNRGSNTVNLGGWQLSGGVSFTFSTNTALGPGSYLVVARDAARLRSHYSNLNDANCAGNFNGKLSHKGEYVALTMPDTIISTNTSGAVVTNTIHITVNDLTYGTGGRWGQWSDGGGSSLELIDPASNNRLAANWADSDETQKSSWVNIETTGVLDNGANYGSSIGYAQIGLLDTGECLVDNIEVRGPDGVNLVANPDFESGLAGWSLQGDHVRSGLETSGYSSGRSLHIRAGDRMWTGLNSCQLSLATSALAAGQTATLRFKARWLRGWPEVLLRLNGNWLEATGAMPVPTNLGTPGARNSRYVTNAGPALYEVTHSPAVPAAGQPVVVTARAHDADGLQALTLLYRIDPSTTYTSATMKDDGTGGDAIAGDGAFSATIPGQATGTLVAFYLSATDAKGASTRVPALLDDASPARECLVLFGDANPAGSFGVYHLWITQANANRWRDLGNLSNEANDCTVVSGDRVIYNAQAHFAGSPFHQVFNTPYGALCHYKWVFPKDDKFLGATSFNKIHQPGNMAGDDPSLQREQLANTFLRALGVPWLNRRYVVVYVNGNRRGGLMEDAQTPDADVVEEHFVDDPDGWLYKVQAWFEFAPALSGYSLGATMKSWATLMPFTTTGGAKKVARYRYSFGMRRTPDSASNFTNLFSLVDAASAYGTPNYVANLERLADMENWMRVFAANHAAGNWDCFGAGSGQNLYAYVGAQGTPFSLLMFDFNIVFVDNWAPGQNLFTVNGDDVNLNRIFAEPAFRRMYVRALNELVAGPLDPARSGPLLDARYQAFVANGITAEVPDSSIKPWLLQARDSIASQLSAFASSFSVNASVTISNNLALISGTAPVDVKAISFNGVEWPVTWKSVTAWTAAVPLLPGNNVIGVVGIDVHGQPLPGASNSVAVVYSGPSASPAGRVVINEIMHDPAAPNAQFVELLNTSANLAFDLSGCQVRGLAYTFPPGSFINPGTPLVLAANPMAFAAAYGATRPVFDTFSGVLQTDGETLTLVKLGTNAANDLVVAKVRYEARPPWPAGASGTGASLQLVDPLQDAWRAGNWSVRQTGQAPDPHWVYVTATGQATSSTLYIYLQSAGDVYVDDLKLVPGGTAEAGPTMLANGDFESAFPGSAWYLSANLANSAASTLIKHSGNASLHLVSTSPGTSQTGAIWQTITPALTNGATYTLSFWYLQNTNGGPLTIRLSGSGIASTINPNLPSSVPLCTPAATNSVVATLPLFPPLWINELQADNLTGITNRAGQHTAWLELYNPGTNTVFLDGLYLANNYSNLLQWAFPANATVSPGQFKVIFADGLTNLSSTNEFHTGFSLAGGAGALALSRLYNGQPQVLDYVNYTNLGPNRSYGSFPDGQSFDRQSFFYATPGATNNGSSAPLTVAINEWMAGNTNTLKNPVTDKFDDWFELYNYGTNTADLAGYYLTHSLTNQFEFEIPAGYTIPPGGFLLVWADKKATNGTPELHANFKLSKSGASIGLYGPDGRPVDYVTFGEQTSDISMGRFPDGSASISFMVVTTPQTNNYLNSPPALTPLPDQYVFLGQTLTVSAQAGDADAPGQSLTFSLDPGAPPEATIHPATGEFTWTPGAAAIGRTNFVTVRVTDNGLPPLSATRTFAVVVAEPPKISVAGFEGTTLMLQWPTVPGKIYRLQYTEDLSAPVWITLGTDLPGTGEPLVLDLDLSGARQGFYRVFPQ